MKNVDVIYSIDTGIVKFFQILFFSKLFGKKAFLGFMSLLFLVTL